MHIRPPTCDAFRPPCPTRHSGPGPVFSPRSFLHKKPKSCNNAGPHPKAAMTPTGPRDLILDAAERLIGALGYSKTTMDDVARAAGVGKRTIYVYFPSKEEVILCTIDRIVDRLVTRLRGHAAGAGSAVARVRAMLVERVLFRFDSVRGYSHGLDEVFASLRPAYLARRGRYFA